MFVIKIGDSFVIGNSLTLCTQYFFWVDSTFLYSIHFFIGNVLFKNLNIVATRSIADLRSKFKFSNIMRKTSFGNLFINGRGKRFL